MYIHVCCMHMIACGCMWKNVGAWGCLAYLWMHLPTEDRSIRSPIAAVTGSCKLREDMGARKQTLQENHF